MALEQSIRVVLADDNLIVREGVRALLSISGDVDVVGVAGDYDELLAGAAEHVPQVVVTDIRMPPDFTDEGIRAARIVRKQHPGTGIVILSQYDEPEYAIALLSEGAAGYAYLLKDRVAEGDQLARAVREVSTGGSMLDPRIVDALTRPVSDAGGLDPVEERLLRMVAEGKPIKAIAASLHSTPTSVADDIEQLFLKLAQQASERFAREENIDVSWERIWNIRPILFDDALIELADEAIREVSGTSHRLPSGPLHDAAEVARAGVPTVMVFVQSLRGLSHTKLEDTKEEHLELSVRALDALASKVLT